MVGRSNVGKSSLINALVRRPVARTSAAPGKTRLANFYRVQPARGPAFYLVDLPGYGFAKGDTGLVVHLVVDARPNTRIAALFSDRADELRALCPLALRNNYSWGS